MDEFLQGLSQKGLTNNDFNALGVAVRAAVRGPAVQDLYFNGHNFHIFSVQKDADDTGITYTGRISHVVSGATDDQVDYRVRVENGVAALELDIDRQGYRSLVAPAVSVAFYLTHIQFGYTDKLLLEQLGQEAVERLEDRLNGPWQDAARFTLSSRR